METRLVELETRVAFQEDTIQQLNDTVTQQQFQLEHLVRELQSIKARLSALTPSNVATEAEETPPPHY